MIDTTKRHTDISHQPTNWAIQIHRCQQIIRSTLAWRITAVLFVVIVLVETAIIVPSSLQFRADLVNRSVETALIAAGLIAPNSPAEQKGYEAALALSRLRQIDGVVGLSMIGLPMGKEYVAGEPVEMSLLGLPYTGFTDYRPQDASRYEIARRVSTAAGDFAVAIRLDTTWIDTEVTAYVWRIAGLVLLISACVSLTTLALVGGWVIRPLFRIRNALTAASRDPANAMNYRLGETGNDEVGETYTAIDRLLFEVSRNYKEQLATLGAIARETSDGIASYGPDGTLTFANAACLRLCHASTLKQLVSERKPLFRFPGAEAIHISQLAPGEELSGQAMLSGINGVITPCLISSRVLTDETGNVLQKFAIFRDITEIRQASKQLEYKNMQLEAADRNKSEFLANVSHELRTPLNAIIGFSNIMRDEMFGKIENSQYRDYIQDIHNSGEHLLQVINALLDLRKVEAGELELTPEAVRLDDLLHDTRRMIAPVVQQHGHSILLDLPSKPVTLLIDRQKMRQVLLNLISNAAKFSPSPDDIRVSATVNPSAGVTISVTDHGIGMTEEEIRIAMTSFGQVDSGLNRRFEGIGLGLPLSLALTELHGGALRLSSIPGKETVATIHLPPDCIMTDSGHRPEISASAKE
ncbi:hypothetical protein GH722_13715 [Alphaproteobacteria bacterium HT1-32]|nr:hypothetical protein [Alphaproteobacteria bacterium HT1-32]